MPKTDSQIRDRLSEILANITVPSDKRRDYCEYKGKDKERYCTITTHKTCKGCHFFSPTMHQRLRVVVDGYDELEASAQESRAMVGQLKNEVANLNAMVAALQYKVARLSERQCPDKDKCNPPDEHFESVEVYVPNKKSKTKIIYK